MGKHRGGGVLATDPGGDPVGHMNVCMRGRREEGVQGSSQAQGAALVKTGGPVGVRVGQRPRRELRKQAEKQHGKFHSERAQ